MEWLFPDNHQADVVFDGYILDVSAKQFGSRFLGRRAEALPFITAGSAGGLFGAIQCRIALHQNHKRPLVSDPASLQDQNSIAAGQGRPTVRGDEQGAAKSINAFEDPFFSDLVQC